MFRKCVAAPIGIALQALSVLAVAARLSAQTCEVDQTLVYQLPTGSATCQTDMRWSYRLGAITSTLVRSGVLSAPRSPRPVTTQEFQPYGVGKRWDWRPHQHHVRLLRRVALVRRGRGSEQRRHGTLRRWLVAFQPGRSTSTGSRFFGLAAR